MKFYHQGARIYEALKTDKNGVLWPFEGLVNPSPLVIKFQIIFFLNFCSILMKYIESPGHLKHCKHDFQAETFFGKYSLNTGIS